MKSIKNNNTLEDFINLTRYLASENDIRKLLGAIINESLNITHAEGGKIYLPDATKKYFDLHHIGYIRINDRSYDEIDFSSQFKLREHQINRVSLHHNGVINSNNYLVYSAITGELLEINRGNNFSSYEVQQIEDYDRFFLTITENVLVMPLCDHDGITIGLLELYNYSHDFDKGLLNAFTSLSAVLINNTNLVCQNNHLINILDETNQQLETENVHLKKNIEQVSQYEIVGESHAIKAVFSLLDRIVDSNVTVLLRGETGTGKELFARAIHKNSHRKNEVFISQNCAALPEELLESELFGYKKGAFTGAHQDKAGLFDQADGGTLFLDEIGDMPVNLQAKVLRVLQEQEVRPLGGNYSHKVNVRIITATHCDLEDKIKSGQFRQDLYYRLNIFPVVLPKLSDRENDVVLLIHHFVTLYNKRYQRNILKIAPGTIDRLSRYTYPGNVRELQNIIERAVLLCHDSIVLLEQHLPVEIIAAVNRFDSRQGLNSINIVPKESLKNIVQKYEAKLIKNNLKANDWNQTITAQVLKVPRRTLVEKISRLNIEIPK